MSNTKQYNNDKIKIYEEEYSKIKSLYVDPFTHNQMLNDYTL